MFALAYSLPRLFLRDPYGRYVCFDNKHPLCCTVHVLPIRQTIYFCCVLFMKLDFSESFVNNPFVNTVSDYAWKWVLTEPISCALAWDSLWNKVPCNGFLDIPDRYSLGLSKSWLFSLYFQVAILWFYFSASAFCFAFFRHGTLFPSNMDPCLIYVHLGECLVFEYCSRLF